MKMHPIKLALLALRLALLAAGLFVGLSSVQVGGFDCGASLRNDNTRAVEGATALLRDALDSPFTTNQGTLDRNDRAVQLGQALIVGCDDALSSRQLVAWPLLIAGGVFLIAGRTKATGSGGEARAG